jgi:hypothetical protein
MHDQISFSSLGLYSSSFLKMHLSVDESLIDIFNLSEKTSAGLLHEYIHFLQDLTTIYGLQNAVSVVQYLSYINFKQRLSGNNYIDIPCFFKRADNEFFFEGAQLRAKSFGTSTLKTAQRIRNISQQVIDIPVGQTIYHANIVQLEIIMEHENSIFEFGSSAINEGMAFLIEQFIYPDVVEPANDFVYIAAQEIVRKEYPVLLNDILNVVALCDASLMYTYPGAVFIEKLYEMRKEGFIPENPEEIYLFVEERTKVEFHNLTNIRHVLNNQSLTAFDQIAGYFNSDELLGTREWIEYTFINANQIRKRNWNFFIELARGGKLTENSVFRFIYSIIGLPLTTNDAGNAYFASPVEDQHNVIARPILLWAVNQIYNIFINSSKTNISKCGMVHWCRSSCTEQNIPDRTSQECFDEPWLKIHDENGLCPFSQVWVSWGLSEFIPRYLK